MIRFLLPHVLYRMLFLEINHILVPSLKEEMHGTHAKAWGKLEALSTLKSYCKTNETVAIETFHRFVARWVQ